MDLPEQEPVQEQVREPEQVQELPALLSEQEPPVVQVQDFPAEQEPVWG